MRPQLRGAPGRAVALAMSISGALLGCSCSSAPSAHGDSPIVAVGAENQYANVIAQIGGRYVDATAIMSNPNADPHSFEASPSVARVVSSAELIVQNGLGYDSFMNTIEAASPDAARKLIDVQHLLKLPGVTANPHLWYDPSTMPKVAAAIARDLSDIDPAHAAYFAGRLLRFKFSLRAWTKAIASFAASHPRTPVATTEPVADYLLQAARTDDKTPFDLQADIMNGIDPAPQDISLQESLLNRHKVKVFLYNEQVTDSITQSFLSLALKDKVPVVAVYETMPSPGYDYQTWMLAEVDALQRAVADNVSTEHL